MNRRPKRPTRAVTTWIQTHRPRSTIGYAFLVAALALVVTAAIAIPLTMGDDTSPSGCRNASGRPAPWTWLQSISKTGSEPQCVGFVTGRSPIAKSRPEAGEILKAIDTLNSAVAERKEWTVTVVAMLPLTGDARKRPVDVLSGIHQLRGIYAALLQHNGDRKDSTAGTLPLIRLVVADVGSAFAYGGEVAEKVVESAKGDQTFAGVIGLNQGRGGTSSAIQQLDEAKIPMVATTATSDDLTDAQAKRRQFDWYWRISAKNKYEARLITEFVHSLGSREKPLVDKPFMVFRAGDAYSENLAKDVEDAYYGPTAGASGWRHSRSFKGQDRLALGGELEEALEPVCSSSTDEGYDAIVFTGRADDLRSLSNAMNAKGCGNIPVVAGDDVAVLEPAKDVPALTESLAGWAQRPLYFVDYAPNSKDLWPTGTPAPPPTGSFFEQYAAANPGARPSSSGMTAYDALIVIAKAASTMDRGSSGMRLREEVRDGLSGICGPDAVRGATGIISFDAYGDPVNKHLVVRKFTTENTPSPVAYWFGNAVEPSPCHVP